MPLYLPATWGLVSATQQAPAPAKQALLGSGGGEVLVAARQRGNRDRLSPLPATLQALTDAGNGSTPSDGRAIFEIDEDTSLALDATLPDESIWPGATIDVQMTWQDVQSQSTDWPSSLSAFVHLRRNGDTVSQADGQPRYFVRPPLSVSRMSDGETMPLVDWRQLTVPDLAFEDGDGEWSLVVGIYDPISGERVDVVDDQGNPIAQEVTIGTLRWSRAPTPDQACALIQATCTSQTSR